MRTLLRFTGQSAVSLSLSALRPVRLSAVPSLARPRGVLLLPTAVARSPPRAVSFSSAGLAGKRPCEPQRRLVIRIRTPRRPSPPHHQPRGPALVASASGFLLVLAAALAASAYYTLRPVSPRAEALPDSADEAMTAEIAPGRPGNLTPEQEEKLKQLWKYIFQVCGVGQDLSSNAAAADSAATPEAAGDKAQEEDAKKSKKSRMSLFSRSKDKDKGKKDSPSEPEPATPAGAPTIVLDLKDGDADKYGQTKHFYETLASQSPESIRDTIWSMVKHDHPDALVLRFLRARKWDVERALIMLVSTMNWRATEMKVDDDIMRNGEEAALAAEKSSGGDAAAQKLGHDFMAQIRKGISYVHGHDKQGRPLCFVNVRLHRQGEQAEEALERYTVYLIETCRMLLQHPVDTATIVFDMTNFSMANMDYTPVKFMIKCFEANYPECLGTVLVHKAPWIFQGIWKVIRGWLDPVVANKVHFTNNAKEMEAFIPLKHIPKDLDGDEDWTYAYVEPVENENARMRDTATRDRLLAARAELYKEYEAATLEWIRAAPGSEEAERLKAARNDIAEKLRVGYWEVDPYVRARSYYDRIGVLQAGGKLNWYPAEAKQEGKAGSQEDEKKPATEVVSAAPAAVETSPDDVD
ncbi:hypothetical protein VTJ83DRAFT_3310 [Remersonia thermophila]|uniref:CRAL-TRIO domain-containing protein n=1 Tax=Remersonia thermophila TaxID=72144 RepID=A0ABR4DDT1_9PEZI